MVYGSVMECVFMSQIFVHYRLPPLIREIVDQISNVIFLIFFGTNEYVLGMDESCIDESDMGA